MFRKVQECARLKPRIFSGNQPRHGQAVLDGRVSCPPALTGLCTLPTENPSQKRRGLGQTSPPLPSSNGREREEGAIREPGALGAPARQSRGRETAARAAAH